MRRVLALGLIGVVLATASGCSGPDGLMRDTIASMNRLSESIERGEPEARQKELSQQVKDRFEKFERLKLGEEQKKALFDKYADEIETASKRLGKAVQSSNSTFDPPSPFR